MAVSFQAADVLVLCYHGLRSRQPFHGQMSHLADHGYSVLSIGQFTEWLNGDRPIRSPAVLLMFDGCYPDQLEHVVPVLQTFKFPATFFPVTIPLSDANGSRSVFRRHEVRELAGSGYTIGCHSHTHRDLTSLSPAGIQREVVDSKRILEDVLGQGVTAFCYPYGAYNASIASGVREAGFDVAFTVDLGGVRVGDDPFQLKRVPVLGEPRS
ncbi:MAG: polysaccharide deacetylase family protein, partial [Candidatus Methylomirabilis sp.]